MSDPLQRLLWILENDLCTAVHVHVGGLKWDSHMNNEQIQTRMTTNLVPMLLKLVNGLKARRNEHGGVWDNSAIMLASEIGRFPKLNNLKGKDHFPEKLVTCLGPWFRGGEVFGVTGSQYEASLLDLGSGKTAKKTGHWVKLDDVGATALRVMGIDRPEV